MTLQTNNVFGFTEGESQNSEAESQSIIDSLAGKQPEPAAKEEEAKESEEAKEEVDTAKADETEEEADDEEEESDEKSKEKAPYHKNPRFQEIRKAKKEIEAKYKTAEERIKELEAKLEQTSTKKDVNEEGEDEPSQEKIDINALKKELLSELENKIVNKDKIESEAIDAAKAQFEEVVQDMQDDGLDVDKKEFAKWINKLGDIDKARIVYSELINTAKTSISKSISKKSVESSSNNKVNKSGPSGYQPGTDWGDIASKFNDYVS